MLPQFRFMPRPTPRSLLRPPSPAPRLLTLVVALLAGAAPAVWAQHAHDHGGPEPVSAVSTAQMLALIGAALVVLRALGSVIRARAWNPQPTLAYGRVEKTRAYHQAVGLAVGALVGLGAYTVLDLHLHGAGILELEDTQTAAARHRVEQMQLDEQDQELLKLLLPSDTAPASAPTEAGDAGGPEEAAQAGEPTPADTEDARGHPDLFHRALLGTVGGAVGALLGLLIPIRRESEEDAAPPEDSADPPPADRPPPESA